MPSRYKLVTSDKSLNFLEMDGLLFLFQTLNDVDQMPDELIADIKAVLQHKHLAKKELLLTPGKICSDICFVEKGILRSFYYQGRSQHQVTGWFMDEGKIVVSIESFFLQQPSNEYIEAIEDTSLYYISYQKLQELYTDHHVFANIGRRLTERYYIMAEFRLKLMRSSNAKARLDLLNQWHPEIFQRVSLGVIASYLGINQSTLSRLRSNH